MTAKKNKDGKEYVLGNDGKKVIINKKLNEVIPI